MELTKEQIDKKLERHVFRKKKLEALMTKIHHRILYRNDCIAALSKKRAIALNFSLPLNDQQDTAA